MLFFVTYLRMGIFDIWQEHLLLRSWYLPLIMRSTEEALKSVPDSYREGSFRTWSRKTPYRISDRTSVGGTGNPGRCDPGDRTNRRRDSSTDLYSGNRCKGTEVMYSSSGRTLAVHMYNLIK